MARTQGSRGEVPFLDLVRNRGAGYFRFLPGEEADMPRIMGEAPEADRLVRLACCIGPSASIRGIAVKFDKLADFAGLSGPLFGMREADGDGYINESLNSWMDAVTLALQAAFLQRYVLEVSPEAAERWVTSLSGMRLISKRTGEAVTYGVVSGKVTGEYLASLPSRPVMVRRRMGDKYLYAFGAVDGEYAEFSAVELGHEMSAGDYRVLMDAVTRSFGQDVGDGDDHGADVPDTAPAKGIEELVGRHYMGAGDEGEGSYGFARGDVFLPEQDLSLGDLGQDMASALVAAMVALHVAPCRMDPYEFDPQVGYLRFPTLLSWLWYDFSCGLGDVDMRFCAQCGAPISMVGSKSKGKVFCDRSCKTKSVNARNRELQKKMRAEFIEGHRTVEEIAKDCGVIEGKVRGALDSSTVLKALLEESIRGEGWDGSSVLAACRENRLDLSSLLHKGLKVQLAGMEPELAEALAPGWEVRNDG